MKRLIISADDYAMSAAIDDGVVDLIERGRVTTASCLVDSPRWPEAAPRLRGLRSPRCAIGLHLDFTEFCEPHRPLAHLILASLLHTLSPAALHGAIAAQFARFEDALGHGPDYVDGHRHVHQLPQIRAALLEVLAARRAAAHHEAVRPWLRVSAVRGGGFGHAIADGVSIKRAVITALGSRALQRAARARGYATTDSLLGVYDFRGGADDYRRRIVRWLAGCEGDAVLMCHPALRLDASDPLGTARHAEYRVLAGDAFASALRAAGVELVAHPGAPV